MTLVVLTGASGAEKTTIAGAFAHAHSTFVDAQYFDRIDVQSLEQMAALHGSPDEWQRLNAIARFRELTTRLHSYPNILFEGQTRCRFVRQRQAEAKIDDVRIVFVDCDDATPMHRLTFDRRQPGLANNRMSDWAVFAR